MGGDAGHLDTQDEHPLGLHADLEVGRLSADHEVAPEAVAHHDLGTVLPRLGPFLVGVTTSSTSTPGTPAGPRSSTASIIAASAAFMS